MPNNMDIDQLKILVNQASFDKSGQDFINTYIPYQVTQGQGDTLITLDQLLELENIKGKKALLLDGATSLNEISLPLDQLDAILVFFASFTDGRGYSLARLLRRGGFKGELRAVGDVFKDIIFYLKRSGFDSFTLKAGKDANDAKQALHTFTSGYQADAQTSANHFQTGRHMPVH